jgi:hypothetical protein
VASDSVTGGTGYPFTAQNSATVNNFVSGTIETGLPAETTIYVQVTAQPSAGFVSNASSTVVNKKSS